MKVGNTKGTINLRQVEEEMLKRHLEGKKCRFHRNSMVSHAEQGSGPAFSAEQEPDWSARRTQKPGLTEERPSQVQDMSGRLRDIYTKINAMSVGETQTEAFQTRDAKEDNGQTI